MNGGSDPSPEGPRPHLKIQNPLVALAIMRAAILLPLLVLLPALAAPSSATGTTTQVVPYSFAPPVSACLPDNPCVTPPLPTRQHVVGPFLGDHFVFMTVQDASTLPVGGTYAVLSPSGTLLGSGGFCGGLSGFWLSSGVRLSVTLDAPGGPMRCAGNTAGATAGSATYTFYDA